MHMCGGWQKITWRVRDSGELNMGLVIRVETPVEDTQLGYGGCGIEKKEWLFLSWLLHKWIKDFSDSNFEIEKSCWYFD